MTNRTPFSSFVVLTILSIALSSATAVAANQIVHDAEYYVLEAQHGEKWSADDNKIDKKLAEVRKKNGGKPPNIVYILLDDVGFGEIGMDELSVIRGYKTPNMDAFAKEGLSLQRMYSEPSCTPTRVAMMTGRHPVRTGLTEAKATIAGEGLAAKEVTLAEVLRDAGYYTSHVGKWHMGDIEQAYASSQGFMHAEYPIHQQGQLAIMNKDSEIADQVRGVSPELESQTFTMDKSFFVNPAHMVTGVELRDGKLFEVDMKSGKAWTQQKYREMNERYQKPTAVAIMCISTRALHSGQWSRTNTRCICPRLEKILLGRQYLISTAIQGKSVPSIRSNTVRGPVASSSIWSNGIWRGNKNTPTENRLTEFRTRGLKTSGRKAKSWSSPLWRARNEILQAINLRAVLWRQ